MNKKGRSVIFYWLGSYVLILLVSMLIMIALYFSTLSTIKKDTLYANELSLTNTRNILDSRLAAIRETANKIEDNFKITNIRSKSGDFASLDNYSKYEAYKNISDAISGSSWIAGAYMYYANSDSVISSVTIARAARYYELFAYDSGLAYEDWKNLLLSYNRGDCVGIFSEESVHPHKICYMRTSPISNRGNVNSAKLVIEIDMSALSRDVNTGQGDLLILDEKGRTLFSTNNSFPAIDLPEEHGQGVSIFDYKDKESGEGYTLSLTTSSVAGWYYVIATSNALFYSKVQWVQDLMLMSVIACAVLCLALIAVFVKLNYNPVRRLMNELSRYSGNFFNHKGHNEFAFLLDAFDSLNKSREKTASRLETYDLCVYALERVFSSSLDNLTPDEILRFYGVGTRFTNYVVALFCTPDLDGGADALPDGIGPVNYFEYAQFTLNSLIAQLFPQSDEIDIFTLHVSTIRVCVINSARSNADMLAYANDIVGKLCELADSQYYVTVKPAVSGVYQGAKNLRRAYNEAIGILTAGSRAQKEPEDDCIYFFPESARSQIVDAVHAGDRQQLLALVDELFVKNAGLRYSPVPRPGLNLFLVSMFDLSLSLISKTELTARESYENIAMHVERINATHNPALIRQELGAIFTDIQNALLRRTESRAREHCRRLTADVCAYVRGHYADTNLSVSSVAEFFGVNPVQLSRSFRENMLEDLPGYISHTRIDRCRRLIEQSKYNTLVDLAQQVGFTNTKTLIRAFKRYTGSTPGQYKKINREIPSGDEYPYIQRQI